MKLLVLDVEGTLFQTSVQLPGTSINSTIWQSIALALGPDAVREEVETHKTWETGGYDSYLDWMKDTISIHQRHNLSRDLFQKLIAAAEYNPGVVETLSQIDRTKYEPVLISGGFRELAARAQKDLNVLHAFAACEYFFRADGSLETYNLLPCDFEGKLDFIQLMLREYRMGTSDWVFVGDGANDAPVAKGAPLSIGYRAHPELRRVVTYAIDDFRDLPSILTRFTASTSMAGKRLQEK